MNLLLATTTLLLVSLATAQRPPPPPRPIGSGGAGAVGPGDVGSSFGFVGQPSGGPYGSVGPGDELPGDFDNLDSSIGQDGAGGQSDGLFDGTGEFGGTGSQSDVLFDGTGDFGGTGGQSAGLFDGTVGVSGPGGFGPHGFPSAGHFGGGRGRWGRPGGGSLRKSGPPSIFHSFPSCQQMDRDIRVTHEELWRRRQIGPFVNRCNMYNFHDCIYRDMNTVRCATRTVPTEQCLQEIMAYVRGTNCSSQGTTTVGTSLVEIDATLTTMP